MSNPETCAFCERTSADPCGDGWEPYYWDCLLGRYQWAAVCPTCTRDRLTYDPDTIEYQFPRTTDPAAFTGPAPVRFRFKPGEAVTLTIGGETARGTVIGREAADVDGVIHQTYSVATPGFDDHRNDNGELWANEYELAPSNG